ncbi:MAG: hypothetical protein QM740_21095 [Acidovorax sp.]
MFTILEAAAIQRLLAAVVPAAARRSRLVRQDAVPVTACGAQAA